MSFFSEASLAMIPSGYKTSKVYSAVPTSGDGDLTFTRSNDTATRVGPDGLIEKVRTNLVLQSETFDNASWNKGNLSVSANTISNPVNGATTADTIVEAATTGTHYLYQSPSLTGSFTYSVYAKAKERDHIVIAGSINSTNFYSALFDLTSGTVQQTANGSSTGLTASIVSVGSGWYRCSVALSSAITIPFVIWTSDGSTLTPTYYEPSYAGDGTSGVYVFGAQAETGDIATDYIETTSAAVSVGPLANVPRLDYLDSSSPRLLLEPQRTNLFQYSEQFDNAYWTKITNGSATVPSVTSNYTTSPDGYQNADRIQFSRTGTDASDFSLIATGNINLSSTGTATLYVKSLTSATQNLLLYWGGGEGAVFSVTTQWTRITLPNLSVANQAILFGTRGGSGNYFNGGDATLDIAVWGAQLEAGAYATSYIPTLGAAVTRGADACSKTGISSLIGQTEGTLFVELEALSGANDSRQICINDGTTSNRVTMAFLDNGTQMQFVVQSGGSVVMNSTQTISGLTTGVKIAYAYKVNDFAVYVNGSLLATDTNGAVPISMSALNFDAADGSDKFFGKVSQNLLFTSRLSNDDLATLTTI